MSETFVDGRGNMFWNTRFGRFLPSRSTLIDSGVEGSVTLHLFEFFPLNHSSQTYIFSGITGLSRLPCSEFHF